jgi:hypothetical protein
MPRLTVFLCRHSNAGAVGSVVGASNAQVAHWLGAKMVRSGVRLDTDLQPSIAFSNKQVQMSLVKAS